MVPPSPPGHPDMTGLPSLLRLFPTRSRSSEKKWMHTFQFCLLRASSPNLGNQQISVERCVFWEENCVGGFDYINTCFGVDVIQTPEDCVNHITCRYGRLHVLDRIVPNARLCNVYTLRICKWCHEKQTPHMFILPYQIPKYSDDFWETKSHGLFNMLPHPTWQSIVWLPRIHQYIHGKGADGISYLRQREKNISIGCSRGRMFPRFWRKYILNK